MQLCVFISVGTHTRAPFMLLVHRGGSRKKEEYKKLYGKLRGAKKGGRVGKGKKGN